MTSSYIRSSSSTSTALRCRCSDSLTKLCSSLNTFQQRSDRGRTKGGFNHRECLQLQGGWRTLDRVGRGTVSSRDHGAANWALPPLQPVPSPPQQRFDCASVALQWSLSSFCEKLWLPVARHQLERTNGIAGGSDDCSFFALMLLPPTRPSVTSRGEQHRKRNIDHRRITFRAKSFRTTIRPETRRLG